MSYFDENDEYTEQIVKIVYWFRENGYDVIMDKMATPEISCLGPAGWAEEKIRDAPRVLVFFSPSYIKICRNCEELTSAPAPVTVSRVWYEINCLMSAFRISRSSAKTVSILMDDEVAVSDLPTWALHDRVYKWPRHREQIVRRLCSSQEQLTAWNNLLFSCIVGKGGC